MSLLDPVFWVVVGGFGPEMGPGASAVIQAGSAGGVSSLNRGRRTFKGSFGRSSEILASLSDSTCCKIIPYSTLISFLLLLSFRFVGAPSATRDSTPKSRWVGQRELRSTK